MTAWADWLEEGYHTATVPADWTNVVAVAAGMGHDLALTVEGKVKHWGYTNNIYNTVPDGLSNVMAVAAGAIHNVALLSNATVVAWGQSGVPLFPNLTNVPAGLSNVTAIAAGAYHTLALKSDGKVVAWGAGSTTNLNYGQFGQSVVPSGLSNVVAIAAGGYHSLALRADGTVVVWGDLPEFPYPEAQGYITTIAAGVSHALVLRAPPHTPLITQHPQSRTVVSNQNVSFTVKVASVEVPTYQWQYGGVNLADATNATLVLSNAQPAQAGDYRVLVANAAGRATSAVARLIFLLPPQILYTIPTAPGSYIITYGFGLSVTATNAAMVQYPLTYQWYKNGSAIPGATYANLSLTPQWTPPWQTNAVEGDYWVRVWDAAGTNESGAWTIHYATPILPGQVPAWGADDSGQIEYPAVLTNAVAIAAGQYHSAAVREDGTVALWGHDWGAPPTDLTNAVAVAAGYDHTLALRDNGTVVAWGDPESAGRWVPTNLCGVKAIAAGWSHNLALLTNGAVVAWGNNAGSPGWTLTNVPSTAFNCIAIAAGPTHNLAVKADGTVEAWGLGGDWQTNVPGGLTNVVAVAAGGMHSLALRVNGTVVAWGDNTYGQTTVPNGLSNVMAIAAGWAHSVALKNDGTVVAWGDNTYGQTNVPLYLAGVKLIAASGYHTLASEFSPLAQYPVDVSKDLLVIYNTNSLDSSNVCAYYLAHRPMVSGANVLGIGSPTAYGAPTNETALPEEFTNHTAKPVQDWLNAYPTKRPQYVILFPDIPSRVNVSNQPAGFYFMDGVKPSVQYQLHSGCAPGWHPFVTSINMASTNDCCAYIDKLAWCGSNYSPGKLILSAGRGGYGNTNFALDAVRHGGPWPHLEDYSSVGSTVARATNGLLAAGISLDEILLVDGLEICIECVTNIADGHTNYSCAGISTPPHLTNAVDVAGYISWGFHSSLGSDYAVTQGWNAVRWGSESRWWVIETLESHNGMRVADCGNFLQWFSPNAFGGTNYSNTPVGAVTHVDEPRLEFVNDTSDYFGLWAREKCFWVCAWSSRRTPFFQAVGDPFVVK